MGNEKRVKPSRSFGTVLYFVLVIALIIGTNVFSLVRRLNEAKEFRERNTIQMHSYLPYTFDFNDPDTWPERSGLVSNERISAIYGKTADGNTIKIPEIRPEQIGNEYILVWLMIDCPDEMVWYGVDNNTVFTIGGSGEKVAVLKPGDEISFEYAVYDDSNVLILGFVEPAENSNEVTFIELLSEITIYDIGLYAAIDLIPLTFFICLYFIVRLIRSGKKKPVLILLIAACICLFFTILLIALSSYLSRAKAAAPVIYLYPETDTEVNVRLDLNGKLTTSYPVYDHVNGWSVTVYPDGTLTDKSGREYPFLFWEGEVSINPDLSCGFCVKGEDTAGFLEKSLKQLGLTDSEADTFIMYWLPQMEGNKYNVISFQTSAYENAVSHYIAPEPDTVITVNMLWYPSNTPVIIEPQDLTGINPSERKGFTVVEWGGEKYRKVF